MFAVCPGITCSSKPISVPHLDRLVMAQVDRLANDILGSRVAGGDGARANVAHVRKVAADRAVAE